MKSKHIQLSALIMSALFAVSSTSVSFAEEAASGKPAQEQVKKHRSSKKRMKKEKEAKKSESAPVEKKEEPVQQSQ